MIAENVLQKHIPLDHILTIHNSLKKHMLNNKHFNKLSTHLHYLINKETQLSGYQRIQSKYDDTYLMSWGPEALKITLSIGPDFTTIHLIKPVNNRIEYLKRFMQDGEFTRFIIFTISFSDKATGDTWLDMSINIKKLESVEDLDPYNQIYKSILSANEEPQIKIPKDGQYNHIIEHFIKYAMMASTGSKHMQAVVRLKKLLNKSALPCLRPRKKIHIEDKKENRKQILCPHPKIHIRNPIRPPKKRKKNSSLDPPKYKRIKKHKQIAH